MTRRDRTIIRDLAKRVAEIAARPEQDEKREIWYAQCSLRPVRPPVYCSPEGSWIELLPEESLTCEGGEARGIERGLRMRIYAAEHFADDQVCDATYTVSYAIEIGDWGVHETYIRPEEERGAYVWDPPIKTRADLDRLQHPTIRHDEGQSARRR